MTKSNNSTAEPRDRLSELHDSLIFHIFWFLPMTDVVKTTLLSRRWRNLWTIAPCLNFDYSTERRYLYFVDKNSTDRVGNFINRALLFWRGIKIQKFKIHFDIYALRENPSYNDIDLWVRFAIENEVEELYLCLSLLGSPSRYDKQDSNIEIYWLPQNLYSCSSLKVLSLHYCKLRINAGNVQWNQLQSLTMLYCYFDEHLANQVFCGSPRLEVFISSFPEMDENLIIRSSSLKMLSIDKCVDYEEELPSRNTQLQMWSPNLETLEILGAPYSKCSLMNVKSLTHANLGFDADDIKFGYWIDFFEETLEQIFRAIQHVEKLTLSDWCIKVLEDMKKRQLLSPSSNVKFLKIHKIHAQYEGIVDLLEIFPKLEILVIKKGKNIYYRIPENHYKSFLKVETKLPNSFLLQLRTVEVPLPDGENSSMFPFIEIVLKCARNLEKMMILVRPVELCTPSMSSMLLTLQELLRMPRASPTAQLICAKYTF